MRSNKRETEDISLCVRARLERASIFGVWTFSVAPVRQPRVAGKFWSSYFFIAGVLIIVAILPRMISERSGDGSIAGVLGLTLWTPAFSGAIFICTSFHLDDPDQLLWRYVRVYFLTFAGGTLLGWESGDYGFFLFAALFETAVWLVLDFALGPTPDALINIGKLAPTSFARAGFGLARILRG